MEDGMEQFSALRGGQAGFGWLPASRGEAGSGEGLEGTLRLVGKDAGSAWDFGRRGDEGNAAGVFDGHRERRWDGRGFQFWRQLLRLPGKLRDQRRRAGLDALLLPGKAEMDFRRGCQQAGGDGAGQIPVEL